MSADGFQPVEENLRESFRALAVGRVACDVKELPGISIASLGVAFQMFNAAFLSDSVRTREQLETRLDEARAHFTARRQSWSMWVCENWIDTGLQWRLSRLAEKRRLRLSAEMPGMRASRLKPPTRQLPSLDCRRVSCPATLADFRSIGARCFYVPPEWFAEVFDERVMLGASRFVPWVAYDEGRPVATAAYVRSEQALGLYNIATLPTHRRRGYAEALTRHICADADEAARLPIVLQSTSYGFRMYQRMGFEAVTRVVVYNSC